MALSERCKLYLVLETHMLKLPLEQFLEQAIAGGVTAIQLRDKGATANATYENALRIKNFLKGHDTLFIINDRCDIASAVDADGVHVGIKDMPLEIVKKTMGGKIVGYSCNTIDDCLLANKYADYVGTGPAFPTNTKQDLRDIIGIEGIKRNVEQLRLPSVAIGGITYANASDILQTGVTGLAISSYICASENVYEDTLALSKLIHERI